MPNAGPALIAASMMAGTTDAGSAAPIFSSTIFSAGISGLPIAASRPDGFSAAVMLVLAAL